MMANKPGWDLAYLLCTNIKVDLRRKIFDESCEAYLSGLRDSGIDFGREELNKKYDAFSFGDDDLSCCGRCQL